LEKTDRQTHRQTHRRRWTRYPRDCGRRK